MQGSREYHYKKPKAQVKGCRALCCSCRISVSSSEEAESGSSDRYLPVSSLAHAMVQERLDQMIREGIEERLHEQRRSARRDRSSNSKCIVMVAMEKSSYDVREDFRESIMEMIVENQIKEPKDLRRLLNCYISMNSEEYTRIILEVFHEETVERQREVRTILSFLLEERMDGVDARRNRWRSLRERLGLKGMMIGCCGGPTWGVNPSTIVVQDDDVDVDNHQVQQLQNNVVLPSPETESSLDQACVLGQTPGRSGMNLAAALAAERHFRAAQDEPMAPESDGPIEPSPDPFEPNTGPVTVPGTPSRVSLMRLLEESDGGDGEMEAEDRDGIGNDTVCCVCMSRKKGAAFIPCGHTFCRVCSRELWLNRGCCPLCNRSILEVLDIY